MMSQQAIFYLNRIYIFYLIENGLIYNNIQISMSYNCRKKHYIPIWWEQYNSNFPERQ